MTSTRSLLLRSALLSLPSLVCLACGGSVAPSAAPGPSVDAGQDAQPGAPTCPATFQVVANVDTGESGFTPHSLGVSNGTLFYAVHGLDPDGGIWTVPVTGGAPTRISSLDADLVWAGPGQTLLAAQYGTLYAVPLSGGATTQIGGFDTAHQQAGEYTIDEDSVYFLSGNGPAGTIQAWRMPRAGGAPVLIYQDDEPDAGHDVGWFTPITSDADSIYFLRDASSHVARLPKSGGTPSVLPITLAAPTLLAAQSGSVYVASEADNRGSAQLEQIPAQSGTPRVFDGIGDPSGATIDGNVLYATGLSEMHVSAGDFIGGAVWAVDTTSGSARPVACTTYDGTTTLPPAVVAVALDATDVYAALQNLPDIKHWTLVRAPR